jgi:NADP-dependent 3-hydroxy acid dehydrogenase YdfG
MSLTRVVCITGASSGIGAATAEEFARQGWAIAIGARRTGVLEDLAGTLEKLGSPRVISHELDVTSKSSVTAFAARVHSEFPGGIDVLVNNAGLALGTSRMPQVTDEEVDAMIDTNVKGAISVLRAFLPGMLAQNRGHIINMGSVAGFWVYEGGSIYTASKHALNAVTRTLRLELNGTPIRITSIDPGMVETGFSEVRFRGDKEKASAVYQGMTPLTAKDIAECIWFAASRPAHVNVDQMVLMPVDQASVYKVHRR